MENLLKETLEALKSNNKTENDIKWVGSPKCYFTWEEFKKVADIEYDSGYGGQEVATDLLIVGEDWWLERHEYDGSEWWEFKSHPQKPEKKIELKALVENQSLNKWNFKESVLDFNEPDEEDRKEQNEA